MSYFSNFPVTPIILDADTLNIVLARNILVRSKFSNFIKNNANIFNDYLIKDGERPETLSYKIYGRSELHWLILMFNDIINPYYGWPLSQHEMDSYLNYKYKGSALYVSDIFLYSEGVKKDTPISNTELVISDSITLGQIGEQNATITSYDPLLGKITTKEEFTTGSSSETLTIQNKNGIKIKTKIIYIENNKTALHHFEDIYGNWLDPRGRINILSGGDLSERIKIYTSAKASAQTLGVIDNTVNEVIINEKKRKIRLLKSNYVETVIQEFSNIFDEPQE